MAKERKPLDFINILKTLKESTLNLVRKLHSDVKCLVIKLTVSHSNRSLPDTRYTNSEGWINKSKYCRTNTRGQQLAAFPSVVLFFSVAKRIFIFNAVALPTPSCSFIHYRNIPVMQRRMLRYSRREYIGTRTRGVIYFWCDKGAVSAAAVDRGAYQLLM